MTVVPSASQTLLKAFKSQVQGYEFFSLQVSALFCYPFAVSTSRIISTQFLAAGISLYNTAIRVAILFAKALENHVDGWTKKTLSVNTYLLTWIQDILIGCYLSATIGTIIHELGHACSAFLLYQKSKITITVDPLAGTGLTSQQTRIVNAVGRLLSEKTSRAITASAGAVFSLIAGLTLLAFAKNEKDPRRYRQLVSLATVTITREAIYALSAMNKASQTVRGHDFVLLSKFGVHPLLSVTVILLIPSVFQLIIYNKTK